ncbi:MAG: hypothetical protein V7607_5063 [Solirubrobacteraceae bacterium]
MADDIVYGRYVEWAVAIGLGLVLVAAAGPAVELTREMLDEHAYVPHHLVNHDHAPEGPIPIKLQLSHAQVAGTAMLTPTV